MKTKMCLYSNQVFLVTLFLFLTFNNLSAQSKKSDKNTLQGNATITTLKVGESIKFPVIKFADPKIADRINTYLRDNYKFDEYDEIDYKIISNTSNILTIEIIWSAGRAGDMNQYHFDLSTGYIITLDQIIMPSKLSEIQKLIINDSRQRLVQVKNKITTDMKNGRGGWTSADKNLWYKKGDWGEDSYEENWQREMKKEYWDIELQKGFNLSNKGITFQYFSGVGLPMSIREEEPSSEYFYSWSVLKPYLMPNNPISSLIK